MKVLIVVSDQYRETIVGVFHPDEEDTAQMLADHWNKAQQWDSYEVQEWEIGDSYLPNE